MRHYVLNHGDLLGMRVTALWDGAGRPYAEVYFALAGLGRRSVKTYATAVIALAGGAEQSVSGMDALAIVRAALTDDELANVSRELSPRRLPHAPPPSPG